MALENTGHVVVCGGGIVGSAIAYYLTLRGVAVTLIEAHSVACGASGKAGGFLARNWCDDLTTKELAQLGFDMHAAMAKTPMMDGCNYRELTTLSVTLPSGRQGHRYALRTFLLLSYFIFSLSCFLFCSPFLSLSPSICLYIYMCM